MCSVCFDTRYANYAAANWTGPQPDSRSLCSIQVAFATFVQRFEPGVMVRCFAIAED